MLYSIDRLSSIYRRVLYTLTILVGLALNPVVFAQPELGDRLVLVINDVPYTQRQVEIYFAVKESLRKNELGSVNLIDANNWIEGLEVFVEDMIVLQEAHRLGGFQGLSEANQRFESEVRERARRFAPLRVAFQRLGVTDQTLTRMLDQVLRVAAFRRSKDRQAEITERAAGETGAGSSKVRWLEDLKRRAIVRQMEGAEQFAAIRPTLGTK